MGIYGVFHRFFQVIIDTTFEDEEHKLHCSDHLSNIELNHNKNAITTH